MRGIMQSYKKVLFGIITLMLVSSLYTVSADTEKADVKQGIVKGAAVNFRREPNTYAEIFTVLAGGTRVNVIERSGDWYKINYEQSTGWIYARYLQVTSVETTGKVAVKDDIASRGGMTSRIDETLKNISEQNAVTGEQIAEYSKKFMGVPYKWGGATPEGFDCSGFTYYIYRQFGFALKRTSSDQATQGVFVDKSELRPGDLIFFDTQGKNNGQITHNGMYVGDNKFIHSANSRTVVKITALTDSYYTKAYVKAKRIIK